MYLRSTLSLAALTLVLAILSGAGRPLYGQAAAAPAVAPPADSKPALDAKFVKMNDIPKKLLVGQCFYVQITVQNTGSDAWGPATNIYKHAVLRAQEPADNTNWGTHFIIQGQGTNVPAGGEFTFCSWLQAPFTPGEYVFQWRAGMGGSLEPGPIAMFGESTPRMVIRVEKRPEEPAAAPPPAPAPGEKQVLSFADFEYAGSFRIPEHGKEDVRFSFSGLALRTMKDGTKRMFFNYTHPGWDLVELEIPALVKLEKQNYQALKAAKVAKAWGKLELKVPGGKPKVPESIHANGGFCWDNEKQTLYWTWWHSYYCDNPPPVLGASRLEEDGTVTNLGPWSVPPMYKWYWGGAIRLPKDFAEQYTGGRTLALGFGSGYSGTACDSLGPSLAAVSEPDPQKDSVESTPLLGYYKGGAAPRDGHYFIASNTAANGGASWMGRQPDGPDKGYCASNDMVRNGIFVSTPKKYGFIAFVVLTVGRIGYDYGCLHPRDWQSCWYFYDPKDLGAAAKGEKKLGEIVPHSRTDANLPGEGGGAVSGSCFDPDTRLLYVYNPGKGCIHAYRLKE